MSPHDATSQKKNYEVAATGSDSTRGRNMATRLMPLAAVLLLCLGGCVTAPATYQTSADFKRPEAGYRLVVMKPDIAVSLLTAGGQLEQREDWTTQARENVLTSLRAQQAKRGGNAQITMTSGDDPALLELNRLHEVVGQSILMHKYTPYAALPTKAHAFDWTLGKTARDFGSSAGYDYALFLFARDSFSSGGRQALQALGALGCIVGVCVMPQGGVQQAFASLVDLKTGNVVWFNHVVSMTGDIREKAGADALVNQLLEPINVDPNAKKTKSKTKKT